MTVGMPTYNRCITLRETIPQVLGQTYTDFEFIIYDDGSTDKTAEVVTSFNDDRIIFINESNKGIPYPLNGILERAKGEYIIILHDHDIFNKDLLAKSVQALDSFPNAGFVLQGSAWINEDGKSNYTELIQSFPTINPGSEFAEKMLLNKESFSSKIHACCMVRAEAYNTVGRFYDKNFGFYSDIDLWLRLMKKYDFVYLPEVLLTFRTREVNGHIMSDRQFEILKWLRSLFHKHIDLIFSSDPIRQQEAHAITESKYKKQLVQTTIYYALQNKRDLASQGLEHIVSLKSQPLIRWWAKKMIQSNHLYQVSVNSIKAANVFRKFLFRG